MLDAHSDCPIVLAGFSAEVRFGLCKERPQWARSLEALEKVHLDIKSCDEKVDIRDFG